MSGILVSMAWQKALMVKDGKSKSMEMFDGESRQLPYHFTITSNFVQVKEASYTRLCSTKDILTVNGLFPGPTLHLRQGDTAFVHVHNKGKENFTIHWHGILQPMYPWSDGPEFITQCPIMPGNSFIQKVIITEEIGTLWWHGHSDWSRATVHGAIIIYPKRGDRYPFPKPDAEIPIILGEWWKRNITDVVEEFLHSGGDPARSDAFMINSHPGDFNSCSVIPDTFKLNVTSGRTYLLRMVNALWEQMEATQSN
nr:laccase-15-like [Coffea arabica]